jgi:drug/metabolite transporter (DMT)-like permease
MRATREEWALFAVCVVLWGAAYAMTRAAMDADASPVLIACARQALAAAILGGLVMARRRAGKMGPPTKQAQPKLALLGLIGGALPFFLLALAQETIASGLVGIIAALTPVLVTAFAWLVAPEDRLTAPKLIGVVLGFLGVVVLSLPNADMPLGRPALWGIAAATAAAVAYAVNTLLVRIGPSIPPLEASAGWTFYGALWSAPFALYALTTEGGPSAMGWVWIGVLAIGPTAIAGLAYFRLIERPGPSFATQTNYVLPLFALGIGAILLGERVTPNAFAALAMVAAGLFIAQEGWRRR